MVLQLKRVGRVWQDVLPVNIYCKAMGTLLNTAASELISRILALEVRHTFCRRSLSVLTEKKYGHTQNNTCVEFSFGLGEVSCALVCQRGK